MGRWPVQWQVGKGETSGHVGVCMVPSKWEEGLVWLDACGVAVGPYQIGFKVGQSIGLGFSDLSKYDKQHVK